MIWGRDAVGRACQAVEGHPLGPITIGFVLKQPSASLKVASLHTETSYRINRGLWPLYLRHGTAQKDGSSSETKETKESQGIQSSSPSLIFLILPREDRWTAFSAPGFGALRCGWTVILLHRVVLAAPKQLHEHWSQYTCKTHVLCVYDSSVYVKSSVHMVLLCSTLSRWYHSR